MSELYIPTGAISLDKADYNFQLRLGIQGYPGTGKTWAATTFSNTVFISGDRGLISHIGRPDIIEIPFYDGAYVDSIVKRNGLNCPPNKKEALIQFLKINGKKFSRNQHLVMDGGSNIQAWYHIWWRDNKDAFVSKKGEEDKWAQWRMKVEYYSEMFDLIKECTCNIIYLSHEVDEYDKEGNKIGIRNNLTGQFNAELAGAFTDWFRALTFPKPAPDKMTEFQKHFELDAPTAKEWIESTPPVCKTIYVWQTQSDNIVQCKTSLVGAPKYILANAASFNKYKRVNTNT